MWCDLSQAFPLSSLEKRQPTVLVICGPDQNGCVGLSCARHLHVFVSERTTRLSYYPWSFWPTAVTDRAAPFPNLIPGDWRICVCVWQEYIPTVFSPKRSPDSLHQDLTVQCERMDLPFLSYLPTEVRLNQFRKKKWASVQTENIWGEQTSVLNVIWVKIIFSSLL